MTTSSPALPQHDPDAEGRRNRLESRREEYRYDHHALPPLPMLEELPEAEDFTGRVKLGRYIKTRSGMYGNALLYKLQSIFAPFDRVQRFEDLFTVLPRPTTLGTWRADPDFAEQRLSGANPLKIRRLVEEDQMPFALPSRVGGRTVAEAIRDGSLYVADYSELAFVKGGKLDGQRKVLPTPKALFHWQRSSGGDGRLMPVAIQVRDDRPVYTPEEVTPIDWLIAKLCVQIADANYHEAASHLCFTHLVMEPFAIATARQLAENHPLGLLLRPHFRFMLANNFLARDRLIGPGGVVERLLAGTLEETLTLVGNAYQTWSVRDNAFPTEVARRGLGDTDVLPHYPYRDDGLLLWNAIKDFATRYLDHYYRSDADVQEDRELQGWAAELASPSYGKVKDMPPHIEDRRQLRELATLIIFTCGPQHCAVNFSQYDYMAFVPNMPLAAYCPVPERNEVRTDEALMSFLPPAEQAMAQVKFAWALTGYRTDRFGLYDAGHFRDPEARAVADSFQRRLVEIEKTIDSRNDRRAVPYKFMKPSEMLNSLSV